MSVSEDFFASVTREINEISSGLDEREKAALETVMGDFFLKPPQVSAIEKGVFMAGVLAMKKQVPVKDIFKGVYRSLSASNRRDRLAVRTRFRSYVTTRLSEDKWREQCPAQLVDRLFGISGGRPAAQVGDGTTTTKKATEGDASRRRRRATVQAAEKEQGTLLPGKEQQETTRGEVVRGEGTIGAPSGDRHVTIFGTSETVEGNKQVVRNEPVTEVARLTRTSDGALIIPIEGCRIDLTRERISMTSFGVEKKVFGDADGAERRQKVNDFVERIAAELRTRGHEVDMRTCGALARLWSGFEYGRAVGYEGFLALSKKPQLRDVYRDTMGSEHWAVVEAALKRLGLAGE